MVVTVIQSIDSFALLDDCTATACTPTSRLYTEFVRAHQCADPSFLQSTWKAVQADCATGLHAVILVDYEWGLKLLDIPRQSMSYADSGALKFLMYRQLKCLDTASVDAWLANIYGQQPPSPAGFCDLSGSVSQEAYEASIQSILDYIRAGETYQVNYTYRLTGTAFGSPVALYRLLRVRQPVKYGALINLPARHCGEWKSEWVLSCSPELFVRSDDGVVTARPMKGTAPRDPDPQIDARNIQWLANDPKNRAENLMIVDLLRNDIGRVAQVGTVKVPDLFTVESYRTVHQMTSTIQARLREGVDFPDVVQALFPCGSITGAPKHHTMELIENLESSPRGLYTGAIGWVDSPAPKSNAIGDFCMSVAIRTVVLGSEDNRGIRSAQLGVGGGIVADSQPTSEFQETLTKARFVSGLDPGFRLFETMRVARRRIIRLEAHLHRLEQSALKYRFAFDISSLRNELLHAIRQHEGSGTYRLRVDLAYDGTTSIKVDSLARLAVPVKFLVAEAPLPRAEKALATAKTTYRQTYDSAIQLAESKGAFDVLFWDEQGYLTEGARSSVFVQIDGKWLTPPLGIGILPGTFRERLLRKSGWAVESMIQISDLARADDVLLCNALRGAIQAVQCTCLDHYAPDDDLKTSGVETPTATAIS